MRAEDVAPRTWLLAAVAGWALLAWLAAMAGMGGRVAPLPEDASLLQPLPQTRPSPPERLGPLARYDAIAARPVFSEDRRPHPFSLRQDDGEEQDKAFDYVLTSVILAPNLKMAVLQPGEGDGGESVRVKLGESAEEAAAWRLVTLEPRRAVFEGPEGERSLDLRAFDGTGGQGATPAVRPAQDPVISGRAERPAPRPGSNPATVTADAAADAAAEAAADAAKAAPATPPPPQAATDAPTVTTPEAQIEAIRQRIQARREQLRREAQQQPPGNNP